MSQPSHITKKSWGRFKGQTDWKNGKPGGALVHVPCGKTIIQCKAQTRSIWVESSPIAGGSGETVIVGELYCPKCDKEPQTNLGAPIFPSEYFTPGG